MKKIAMIGVGKLGQDCAEVMADAGYDVVGYDVEPRNPKFPMRPSIQEAVSDRDIIFIAAPTPHDPIYGGETPTSHLPNKDFDYTIVRSILTEVNKHVNRSQLVVLISTVLPGTVRNHLEPCITNARFVYNPYLIAMGTIKWDMVNPEMVIIGTEDGSLTGDAKELIDFYKVFMENDPRYEVGTWDEAESIKIFYNTFISTKLALVNMIQDVAETNGNINVDVVTNALKKSTYRIMGPAYMQAAFGDAGACHPRDNIALRYLADRLDLGYDLFDAIMHAREIQAERMALRCLKNGRNVTIIGKAYKPGVPYTNGSASMLVGYYIEKHGGNLNYYDPNTNDNDLRQDWTQVYLIGYWEPWVENIKFIDSGAVVIDPWRKITDRQYTGEIIYYGDTRPKNRYTVPSATVKTMEYQVFEMFPNLTEYKQSIHLVDATINSNTTFILRPTEDIVKELLEAKKLGKSKFIFFVCTEAFMPHVVSKIQRLATLLEDEIEDKDFILLTSIADGAEIYKKIKSTKIWNKNISIFDTSYLHYVTSTYAKNFKYIGGYDVRNRGKVFLCLNKLNREHRMRLVDKFLANGLINKAFYSFEGDSSFVENIDNLSDTYENIKLNKELFPIRLNITAERSNPTDIQADDLHYYKDSYFSLVTETLFYDKDYPDQHHKPPVENSIFLTEKTYRCFALLHPFILMARPYALQELRKQGFKTFMPYIDETYDTIEDDEFRLELIVREVIRLSNLDGPNWITWQQGIKEIVEYNQRFFHEKTDFAFTKDYINLFIGAKTSDVLPSSNIYEVQQNIGTSELPKSLIIKKPEEPKEIPVFIKTPTPAVYEDDSIVNLDTTQVTHQYENGTILTYPTYMSGGGYEIRDEIYSLIKKTGQHHYDRGLEWCSGVGPLGYDLLDKDTVNTMTFVDIHQPSIDECIRNAKINNLLDRISSYVCSSISVLPDHEKFDVVVANPPHSGDRMSFVNSLENKVNIENVCRIVVDDDYQSLCDFYRNIVKYLNKGADLYITTANQQGHDVVWAKDAGLKFLGFHRMISNPAHGIYHFTLV